MSDNKTTNIFTSTATNMEGNFYDRACYFWKLANVDLYNPGPSQIVDDIMEKDRKKKEEHPQKIETIQYSHD
jgi:hypothetical protein